MKGTAQGQKSGQGGAARATLGGRWGGTGGWARGPLLGTLIVLVIVWVPFSLVPEESGWNFGTSFKLFYSGIGITGGLFFVLLKARPSQGAGEPARVIATITMTYLLAVGVPVGVGMTFPQFEVKAPGEEAEGASAADRGKALFQDPGVGCYLCHTVTGAGGLRGPDVARIAEVASARRPGVSADEYLRESITNPAAYLVPDYPSIMPANFGDRLSTDQIEDLVAYLKSLR